MANWPDAGVTLWAELARAPGRFAVLCGQETEDVARELADLRGAVPFHVGRALAAWETRPSVDAIRARLRGHPVLVGIGVLFDPILELDPLRFLAQISRDHPPLIAAWPVPTFTSTLIHPSGVGVGRDAAPDLQGCLLLTTRPTVFADDVPFTAERFI